mgnify:CR=1 FL=1
MEARREYMQRALRSALEEDVATYDPEGLELASAAADDKELPIVIFDGTRCPEPMGEEEMDALVAVFDDFKEHCTLRRSVAMTTETQHWAAKFYFTTKERAAAPSHERLLPCKRGDSLVYDPKERGFLMYHNTQTHERIYWVASETSEPSKFRVAKVYNNEHAFRYEQRIMNDDGTMSFRRLSKKRYSLYLRRGIIEAVETVVERARDEHQALPGARTPPL